MFWSASRSTFFHNVKQIMYKFKVRKQTTVLSELVISLTANSYREALNKFNKNIYRIETSLQYKELDSSVVFCVEERFMLKPVESSSMIALTEDNLLALKELIYQNLDVWDCYQTEDGCWDYIRNQECETTGFDVNFWTDDQNRYRVSVYPVELNEVDYSTFSSYIVEFIWK